MVFNALKQPTGSKNQFKLNDVVFKVIGERSSTHYYVSKIINEHTIECTIFDTNGKLSDGRIQFSGSELNELFYDAVATRLLNSQKEDPLCL